MKNKEVTCRCCGTVLALALDTEGVGFIVHSPVQSQFAIHITPHGRTSLRCSRCGTVREWYPATRRKGGKPDRKQENANGKANGTGNPPMCPFVGSEEEEDVMGEEEEHVMDEAEKGVTDNEKE